MDINLTVHPALINWEPKVTPSGLAFIAPLNIDKRQAINTYRLTETWLNETAAKWGEVALIYRGSTQGLRKFAASNSVSSESENTDKDKTKLSSYNPSNISSSADYETVLDFVKGKKSEGLIVTITAMNSDKCLMVNDLQALDRGGRWTAQDWIGIDFKTLWRDSFHVGKTNYYGQLIATLERDKNIPNFYYQIRRPSGALAEYSSSYHLIDNFLGGAVRIAVSVPGDWKILEGEEC